MEKSWYLSKSVWMGLIIAGVGVARAFGVELPMELIYSLAGGFGIIGLRDAVSKNK